MRSFIRGMITAFILMLGIMLAYVYTGGIPVATSAAPLPFEKYIANKALHEKLEKEMPRSVPITADESNYLAGAMLYLDNCAVCHGAPGRPMTAIANGMYPKPPELLHGKGVTDDTPGETYWKVVNGIRLSGMPGFKGAFTDTQAWQVSLLLANADKLPSSVQAMLAAPPAPAHAQ